MITFRNITIEDQTWIIQKLKEDNKRGCEYSFANNFIWATIYQVEVAKVYDCCVIRFQAEGDDCYAFPIGNGDKEKVIEELLQHAKEDGSVLHFESLLAEDKEFLETHFKGRFQIEEDRDSFDYLYTTEKLTTLSGRKLHGKRNHIARFKEQDWTYEPFTEQNKEECYRMNVEWCDRRACKWNRAMSDEQCALSRALEYYTQLGLSGGVLRVAGEIVAFCIGEALNADTYVVHFEKAFPDMQGAYPMINQQFVTHNCQDYRYVNREDDTGDEGLRKAKLSYYPDILLEKYTATQVCDTKEN